MAPYFSVSPVKLAVMAFATFGIYELYWFYQQWKRERTRTGEDLSPFWRMVFGGFFSFSLFRRMKDQADAHGVPVPWNPTE